VSALPLVMMSGRLLAEMATFGDAGVSGKSEERAAKLSALENTATDQG
jgi:hypothetical protein